MAAEAREEADRPACEAWNKRMLAFRPTRRQRSVTRSTRVYLVVR
jgi:hypothetical protein